jgi:hypothetical protein
MNTYNHTQPGTLIVRVMSMVSLVMLIIGLTLARPLLLAVPIFAICGWLFRSLTIEIADGELRWCFGSGIIWKRIPLNQIASVNPGSNELA